MHGAESTSIRLRYPSRREEGGWRGNGFETTGIGMTLLHGLRRGLSMLTNEWQSNQITGPALFQSVTNLDFFTTLQLLQ